MDTPRLNQLINDLHSWGGSLYYTQGWRLPYWEEEDWRQYAVEWGLKIVKHYGQEIEAAHAFTLVRTSLFRDLVDLTHSVHADLTPPVGADEQSTPDVSWTYCVPKVGQELLTRLLALPLDGWEKAEGAWKALGRKKLTTSSAGLSFLTGLPQNEVEAGIVALREHYA
ncbi:MAG: hypothetical protein ACREHG_00630 [Candidatus Saccharimonadales bacterium]